ncbi:MAG: CBS domain-containing protein [Thaumarchaeota archaeon]|nr:CBS domain-containing protein [Nitrososphaerota archaeon]
MAYGSRIKTKVLLRDVMNSPVITISPDAKADAVAKKMSDLGVGSLIVVQKGTPIGIITDTDLVEKVVAKNAKPNTITASKILSSPLKTIDFMEDLPEAARLIRKQRVKRLGVVRNGNLIGIISLSDILAVTPELMEIVSEKARIMTGESRRAGAMSKGIVIVAGDGQQVSMRRVQDGKSCGAA